MYEIPERDYAVFKPIVRQIDGDKWQPGIQQTCPPAKLMEDPDLYTPGTVFDTRDEAVKSAKELVDHCSTPVGAWEDA